MAPIFKEYWEFSQSWLDYVIASWLGNGRVQKDYTDSIEINEFRARATQAFTEQAIPTRFVKTYISMQLPSDSSDVYADHYPHTHAPPDATTLIHYLQPGDKPAPLDIFEGKEVIETIYPERGLTVFVPNHVMHGVRINRGTLPRIQMIATALR